MYLILKFVNQIGCNSSVKVQLSVDKLKPFFGTHSINVVITFQLELNVFRAQWMSELKPSSGASGTSNRLLQAKGLRKAQEIAREEKASWGIIFF